MPIQNTFRSLLFLVPAAVVAAGCVASTDEHESQGGAMLLTRPPPLPPPPAKLPDPPSAPGAYSVTAYPTSVVVGWASPDATVNKFIVYRRDAHWAWQEVHTEINRPGATYSWVDGDRSLSAQCYMVVGYSTSTGLGSSTKEQCTVRPDASVFPQGAPSAAVEWFGLSSANDGVGPLDVGDQFLQLHDQTWGISLGFGHNTGDNVKTERQGGGSSWPLMKGEAVALRVWGAGWLKHGFQTWGVDLVLSDTPSYEWYVVGDGTPGQTLDNGKFALWNRSAGDYLVKGDQTWGVGLNWYQKTLPPQGAGGTPPPGVKTLVIYNCIAEARPLEMWVLDVTAGTGWVDLGSLGEQWSSTSCPDTGSPWTFTPTPGHHYVMRAMDTTAAGCSNSPDTSSCTRLTMTFVGDGNGKTVVQTAG